MAERLESYDEQNIEELTAEKSKARNLVSTPMALFCLIY